MEHLKPTTVMYVPTKVRGKYAMMPLDVGKEIKRFDEATYLDQLSDRYVFTRSELESLLRNFAEDMPERIERAYIEQRISSIFSGTKQEGK